MKKKIALFCAVVMLTLSFAETALAINVIMNSSFLEFPDQEPVIENGVTLVPLRTIAEALGLGVSWDDPTDTVTLKKDNFFIELVIGSTTAKTSSGVKTLDVAPKIINSRTMVPLRFIAEELGLTVLWNQEYQRVIINGQVDTQKLPVIPVEEESETEVYEDESFVPTEKKEEEYVEEETEFVEDVVLVTFEATSSVIDLVIPLTFYAEDTENEESFAYKTLDATDSQHTYNWDIVTRYESFCDESGTSGISVIVQDFGPYEGEAYDLSGMNQEYPEAPERPERPQWPNIDFDAFTSEYALAIVTQMFIDLEMEVPENVAELNDEDLMGILGFETEEELRMQMEISTENADFSAVTGYEEFMIYQEEMQYYNEEMQIYNEDKKIYDEEVGEINAIKNYAIRNFSTLVSQASDEDWAILFDSTLNTDPEVRFEGVEILDINGKKIVHATLYAEDPDDEQGVFDYYYYIDGDCAITIYGGTLYGSEPSFEVMDALSNMNIQ